MPYLATYHLDGAAERDDGCPQIADLPGGSLQVHSNAVPSGTVEPYSVAKICGLVIRLMEYALS